MHIAYRCECVREFAFEPELLFIYPVVEVLHTAPPQHAEMYEHDSPILTKPRRSNVEDKFLLCQQCRDRTAIVKKYNQQIETKAEEYEASSCGGVSPDPLETELHAREGGFFDCVSLLAIHFVCKDF